MAPPDPGPVHPGERSGGSAGRAGPLSGRRVVVTRAAAQAGSLVRLLRERGAEPVVVPVILIADAADGGIALQAAAGEAGEGRYDWVVLASANAADRWARALTGVAGDAGPRVAVIGPGTARALADHGIEPDLVPHEHVAEGLVDAFPEAGPAGGRVLLPQAAVARNVLAEGLRAKGWDVDVVEAYRTVPAPPPSAGQLAAARAADAVVFTSSSTVTAWLASTGADAVPPVVACIGPVTAATAREHGLSVDVVPAEHTVPGLVAALEAHFGS